MKVILEIVLSVVLHPVAMVLAWINMAGRMDLTLVQKAIWAILCVVWGVGPILYVLFGGGELW